MDLEHQPEPHQPEPPAPAVRPGAIAAGLLLLGLGAALLLDNVGLTDIRPGRLVAPLILIALGTSIVLDKGGFVAGYHGRRHGGARVHLRRRGGAASGVWLIGVGGWMLLSQAHWFGLTFHTSWPILVILSGVMIVIRGIR